MIASSRPSPHAALSRRRARALTAALLASLAFTSTVMRARDGLAQAQPQTAAPPSEEQVEAARALYREARELRRQGKTKEALEKILDAYRTASTPVTAVEAGHMLADAGRLVQARDIVRSVSLLPVSPRESDKGREARQDALTLASALDARVPKIAVAQRPVGVDVLLDGKPVPPGDSNAWQGVDPGAHALVVRVNDRPCTTVTVSLAEGEARTVDFHDVAATCRNDVAAADRPTAKDAPPAAVTAPVERSAAPAGGTDAWRWSGVALAGAGVLVAGVGGFVALHAKSDYDGVANECPARGCTQAAFDTRESARSRADVGGVVVALGALAIAGGVTLFVLNPGAKSTTPATGSRARVDVGFGNVALTITTP